MKKIDENLPSVLEDEEAKELTELSADEEVASTGSKEIAVEPETTETPDETDNVDDTDTHSGKFQVMLSYLRKKIETLGQYIEE